MIKKIYTLLALVLLIQFMLPAAPIRAAGGPTVLESSAEISFPGRINFSITAESDRDINDIRLHFSVNRRSYASVTSEIYIRISPGTRISTEWAWDMRKTGGLPPGTVIRYWWSVGDAAGRRMRTEPEELRFDDNRFKWQTLKKDGVTLLWYQGSSTFAGDLLDAAVEGLERLRVNTGARLDGPVSIYIYADSADLQSAMIFPQTWTGGVAYSLYGTVAIGIKPDNLEWGLKTVVHELTHLVIHQMTYNPYQGLPTWLDEGLAMYMEGPLTGVFNYYLSQSMENGTLLSVRNLTSPFSAYADQSYLSYAESHSMVSLLVGRYGQEKMLEFLTLLSNGSDYDRAMTEVYGFNLDGFDKIWREFLRENSGKQAVNAVISEYAAMLPGILPGLMAGSIRC